MSETDTLRYGGFGEVVGEKRRTILSVSFTNGAHTNIELEPCTLEYAVSFVERVEKNGVTVLANVYSPCHHSGDSVKDVAFRHPPHTIERIKIMRRREWGDDET